MTSCQPVLLSKFKTPMGYKQPPAKTPATPRKINGDTVAAAACSSTPKTKIREWPKILMPHSDFDPLPKQEAARIHARGIQHQGGQILLRSRRSRTPPGFPEDRHAVLGLACAAHISKVRLGGKRGCMGKVFRPTGSHPRRKRAKGIHEATLEVDRLSICGGRSRH